MGGILQRTRMTRGPCDVVVANSVFVFVVRMLLFHMGPAKGVRHRVSDTLATVALCTNGFAMRLVGFAMGPGAPWQVVRLWVFAALLDCCGVYQVLPISTVVRTF